TGIGFIALRSRGESDGLHRTAWRRRFEGERKMRVTVRFLLILGGLTLLFYTLGRFHSDARQVDATNSKRIRFQVTTVEERVRQRNVISEALIEGPPGTDFKVALHGWQYNMDAYFLTDLEDQDSLKVRARLNTRRLYGYSERELPLYEEDAQSHALQ